MFFRVRVRVRVVRVRVIQSHRAGVSSRTSSVGDEMNLVFVFAFSLLLSLSCRVLFSVVMNLVFVFAFSLLLSLSCRALSSVVVPCRALSCCILR